MLKSAKVAASVLVKLADAVSKASEPQIDFFTKSISVSSYQLEDAAYLVASELENVTSQILFFKKTRTSI